MEQLLENIEISYTISVLSHYKMSPVILKWDNVQNVKPEKKNEKMNF